MNPEFLKSIKAHCESLGVCLGKSLLSAEIDDCGEKKKIIMSQRIDGERVVGIFECDNLPCIAVVTLSRGIVRGSPILYPRSK